jgi:hypothetical protein
MEPCQKHVIRRMKIPEGTVEIGVAVSEMNDLTFQSPRVMHYQGTETQVFLQTLRNVVAIPVE